MSSLSRFATAINYINYERTSCDLDSKFISPLFTFKDLADHSSFNTSYAVTYPNLYTLRFANCNPLSHVTMNVHAEFYNTHNGNTKDYLSAGKTKLPSLYFKFSLIYLCSIAFWIAICLKNHQSFHWIHMLMGVLLLVKGFNLFCAYKFQLSIKVTGIPHHVWSVFFYIFKFIKNALLYMVIAVITDGCCFLKPGFPLKFGLMIVIPFQVFYTIGSKVEPELVFEDAYVWEFWIQLADLSCKLLLIVLLGTAVCKKNDSTNNGGKSYLAKFGVFVLFYIVLIVYSFVEYFCGQEGSGWAMICADEVASVVLYVVMFLVFRPSEKNEYFGPLDRQIAGGVCGV